MIRKLRQKFIAIAMASLLGTMAVLCAAIGIADYYMVSQRADKAIELLYQNNGSFPDVDVSAEHSEHNGFQITAETPFETRYFVVKLDSDDDIDSADLDHIAALDRHNISSTVDEIVEQDTDRGYVGQYRFGCFTDDSGSTTIVVVDCFSQLQSARSMLRMIVTVFVLCAVMVFLLLWVLSKRAIRPFVENWHSQRQFITDASHELKTPLAILSANMGLIEPTEANQPWLDSSHEQIVRMDGLIKNLVELARSEEELPASAVTEVPLSEIVQACAQTFIPLAESENKSLSVNITPDLMINGVQEDMRRLVTLLLDNAVKYCDAGGMIGCNAFHKGKHAVLEISNPCAGLDASQLPRYFDRFYRADASRARTTGGSGIGLSTAKAIVTRHHGSIADRYENGVITFSVTLPCKS